MPRVRAVQKIVRNGNSLTVNVPRPMLNTLGWSVGTRILLELREGCMVVAALDTALENTILNAVDTSVIGTHVTRP